MRRGKRPEGEEMDICTSVSGIFLCVCMIYIYIYIYIYKRTNDCATFAQSKHRGPSTQ